MSTQAVAEAGPKVRDAESGPAKGLHPAALAISSGVLLWCAFPTVGWGWLAWVALAPFFALIASQRPARTLYLAAWLGGMVFWLLAIEWVRLTDPSAWLAWVVMATALSFWWPGFLALARLAVLRLRVPIMVAAPVLWIALEYLRAHILSGFPWYYLAHSQHSVLCLIQIADVAGALGLSFLIALANAGWADLRRLRPCLRMTPHGLRPTRAAVARVVLVAALVAANVGYGVFRISTARFRPGPTLALIQSNLIQRYKMSADPAELIDVYRRLIERAAPRGAMLVDPGALKPDLIVWPETSYPYPFVRRDPKVDDDAFARLVLSFDAKHPAAFWADWMKTISSHLHTWTDELKTPMLVGVVTYDFQPDRFAKFNAALLFEPGVAGVQAYYKIQLVPFGEYVPLIETFPWLTALTPYHGGQAPSLAFGPKPGWFALGPYRFSTAICFEDTVPHVVRRSFREAPDGRHPDVLINMSNDGWFHGSSELDMHLAVSVFRAVENRVPLARAVNTGISALIDGNGAVRRALPKLTEEVLVDRVWLDDRQSLYTRWGDWLGLSCLGLTLALGPWGLIQAVRTRLRFAA